MGAVVGHESHVGACAVIAPNAVLNARVVLGEGAYVGSNASILPEVTIGAWAIVGAGSAVMYDVPAGASAVGVPAEVYARKTEPAAPLEVAGTAAVELEGLVFRLWCEVLHLKTVGREQNFFDLGGTSLLAIICRERIRQETGCDLALTDMFSLSHGASPRLALEPLGSPMGPTVTRTRPPPPRLAPARRPHSAVRRRHSLFAFPFLVLFSYSILLHWLFRRRCSPQRPSRKNAAMSRLAGTWWQGAQSHLGTTLLVPPGCRFHHLAVPAVPFPPDWAPLNS